MKIIQPQFLLDLLALRILYLSKHSATAQIILAITIIPPTIPIAITNMSIYGSLQTTALVSIPESQKSHFWTNFYLGGGKIERRSKDEIVKGSYIDYQILGNYSTQQHTIVIIFESYSHNHSIISTSSSATFVHVSFQSLLTPQNAIKIFLQRRSVMFWILCF